MQKCHPQCDDQGNHHPSRIFTSVTKISELRLRVILNPDVICWAVRIGPVHYRYVCKNDDHSSLISDWCVKSCDFNQFIHHPNLMVLQRNSQDQELPLFSLLARIGEYRQSGADWWTFSSSAYEQIVFEGSWSHCKKEEAKILLRKPKTQDIYGLAIMMMTIVRNRCSGKCGQCIVAPQSNEP